jgi:hypothetical protein
MGQELSAGISQPVWMRLAQTFRWWRGVSTWRRSASTDCVLKPEIESSTANY